MNKQQTTLRSYVLYWDCGTDIAKLIEQMLDATKGELLYRSYPECEDEDSTPMVLTDREITQEEAQRIFDEWWQE